MFVTIGNISQHMSGFGAEALLVTGNARISTALEAAQCIHRLIINGDSGMHAANEEFNRIYSTSQSLPGQRANLPNPHMSGFSSGQTAREIV